MINSSNAASVTLTPTFGLQAHSNLQLAFGGAFQKDSGGNYVDKSDFPSLKGDFEFDWAMSNASSLASASRRRSVSTISALMSARRSRSFLLPIIKPFYDATKGMDDVINFLTTPVPIISDCCRPACSGRLTCSCRPTPRRNAGLAALRLDMMVDSETSAARAGSHHSQTIAPIAEAVFSIIMQLDSLLHRRGPRPPAWDWSFRSAISTSPTRTFAWRKSRQQRCRSCRSW